MPKYIPYNYDQHSMVVINDQEQRQPGSFEHAIHFRFSLRSKTKIQSQWRMVCLVHNVEKLKSYGQLAA